MGCVEGPTKELIENDADDAVEEELLPIRSQFTRRFALIDLQPVDRQCSCNFQLVVSPLCRVFASFYQFKAVLASN